MPTARCATPSPPPTPRRADRILLQAQTYRLSLPAGRDEEGDVVDEDDNLNGDLDIHDSLEIIGQGPAATVISGTPQANDRLLEVFDGARVVLERLRLTGGHSSTYGGALENHGEVVLRQVEVSRNSSTGAFSPGNGGGIANDGRLAVHRSVIANNRAGPERATSAWVAASTTPASCCCATAACRATPPATTMTPATAAASNRGTADVARTTFSGNGSSFGSAIGNDGTLTLVNSTLSGNTQYYRAQATLNNGQPWISASPQALLVNVTIANNSGGYGLINTGSVTLRNSIIAGNLDEGLETPMNCDNQGAQAQYKAIGLLLGTGPGNCTGDLYVEQTDVLTKVLYPWRTTTADPDPRPAPTQPGGGCRYRHLHRP